jgi:hypothetical protein
MAVLSDENQRLRQELIQPISPILPPTMADKTAETGDPTRKGIQTQNRKLGAEIKRLVQQCKPLEK